MQALISIPASVAFDLPLVGAILVLVILLSVSALLSAAGTALFSLSTDDLDTVKHSSSPSDHAIRTILAVQDRLPATNRIVNNILRICIVLLAGRIIDRFATFGNAGWEFTAKALLIVTLILLLTEIAPRLIAARKPLRVARLASRPQLGLIRLMKPFTGVFTRSGNAVTRALSGRKPEISMDELSDAIGMTKDQSNEEKQMLTGVISFASTEVGEVMRPRIDIVALNENSRYDAVKRTIIESGFSRIPVYEENLDRIKGILYVKDILPFIGNDDSFAWQSLLRQAYFVPERMKINDLLEEFQSKKMHIAIVVDEYGATAGLISLEDVLEEIVGEILDESDVDVSSYVKIDDLTYVFDGKTSLNDFEKRVGLDEDYFADERKDAESIAGLMLETKGGFLKKGESITVRNIRFTVQSVDRRRINDVRIVLPEPASALRKK